MAVEEIKIRLKELKNELMLQMADLPHMAKMVAPDLVRRAEKSVITLHNIIRDMEALSVDEK